MTPSLAFASAGWTPLVALDVASAAVGCALALLCLVGFVPLVRLQGTPAQRRIVLMLVAFFLIALTRMAWWDLLRPLEALVGLTGPLQRSARAALINLGFNVAACGALLLGLSALHVSIPPEDRGPYGWLTAPWYPPGSRPFVRLFLGARGCVALAGRHAVIPASYVRSRDPFEWGCVAGSFHLARLTRGGLFSFRFVCPCGCGAMGALLVGDRFRSPDGFAWCGSTREVTIDGPIRFVGHWEGVLTWGRWRRDLSKTATLNPASTNAGALIAA